MTTFLTSDRHFSHRNMTLEGCNLTKRNFVDTQVMNQTLIDAHNSVVTSHDTVIDMGDIGLSNPKEIYDIYTRLNGSFIIIKGNHDTSAMINYFKRHNYIYYGRPKFVFEDVGYRFKVNGYTIYCTHYPLNIGERGKVYNIHGHIHEYESPNRFGTNVGVDSPEYTMERFGQPIPLERVLKHLEDKSSQSQ